MNFYVEYCPRADYDARERERLPAHQLEEAGLFYLMMPIPYETNAAGALRAPVQLRGLSRRLGRTTFEVLFTNTDLQPLPKGRPSRLSQNYWVPRVPLPLIPSSMAATSRRFAVARTGYFVPYETDIDNEFSFVTNQLTITPDS